MKESKPLPKLLQWPWCVIVYGVLAGTAWGALYYFLRPFI